MRAIVLLGLALTLITLSSGYATGRTHHSRRHTAAATAHHRTERHAATSTAHNRAATRHATAAIHRRTSRHAAAATGCGGADRWDVKDGSDNGATHVHPVPVNGITIAELNQLPPQTIGADGRMQVEKVIYRLTAVLRLLKLDADGDYHVIIADDGTTPYSVQSRVAGRIVQTPASGHSMVIEIPDPGCVAGKHRDLGPSHFLTQLQESRADFEAATQNLPQNQDLGSRNIPITVDGVLFFDFLHGQKGHALPQPSQEADHHKDVAELHPVLCNDVAGYRARIGKAEC